MRGAYAAAHEQDGKPMMGGMTKKYCFVLTAAALLLTTPARAGEFAVHGNGTLTDKKTSLVWQQQDDGVGRNWEAALAYCENLTLAGHDDWRLPNIKELESLTEEGLFSPAIDQDAFPNTKTAGYWSSTSLDYNPAFAWFVYFNNGYVNPVNKPHEYYTRCVRGGY